MLTIHRLRSTKVRLNMDKRAIAEEYLAAPKLEVYQIPIDVRVAYAALADECTHLARQVRLDYHVVEVDNADPYKTAADMFVAWRTNSFEVSRLYCEHPLWTPGENINFRIVHDFYGHFAGQAAFSWEGEQCSYLSQCTYHSTKAQEALFTEIIGQTAVFSLTRSFPDQKAILLETRHG